MFEYKWKIRNGYPAQGIKKHGTKVYSTFACGGGSTMGYKLAGFDVIGANDIDPQMAKVYKHNHNPKFYDLCPIGDMLTKKLPQEYYNLDILDGSPPCSTFSISGKRENSWKKNKKFREGQATQVLSDLFFDWIALVDRLQPNFAIAENVKGMLAGNAKAYTKKVILELNKIGYDVQLFLLNSASMGVPQRRERVFFICKKKKINLPKLELKFNEKKIVYNDLLHFKGKQLNQETEKYKYWLNRRQDDYDFGGITLRMNGKSKYFTTPIIHNNRVPPTITASPGSPFIKYTVYEEIAALEYAQIGSFPLDYDYLDISPKYLIGMSVPPVMIAQIAYQIYVQWIKLYKSN